MTLTRLQAHTPNGALLGPVPAPQSLQVGYPLNDVGALALEYPIQGPRSSLLGQPVELAVEVSHDQGDTWAEPESSRFLYWRDGRDPVKGDGYSIEAPAYVIRLSKAVVAFTGLDADGNRTFIGATHGAILHTLLTEAQARGALTGLTWNFTAANDSAGAPWASTANISYEPGKDLLAILAEFAALGVVDFRTQGRQLQVFNAGTTGGMAPDRTTGANPVSLRFGRDLTEAPFRRTWEGLADAVLVGGDEGANTTRTNAGALKPWGRQETYVSAAGVSDAGTLAVIGDASLSLSSDVRVEHTFGLDFNAATFLPFRDYTPGAWVWKNTDGTQAPERMRVRQVTLTRDATGQAGGNVVLNDRFLESDVAAQRRLQALTNGATAATGGTPAPIPVGNDILAPAQVLGLGGTSVAYLDGTRTRAQVSLDWADVTTNADATPATDIDHYEVQWRKGSAGTFATLTTVAVSNVTWSPFEPDTLYQFQVRAVDTVGNNGAWSAVASVTTSKDTTPPSTPSTPTLSVRLGVVTAVWDGKNSAAGAMDPDTSYVEVHASPTSGFAPSVGTLQGYIQGAGYVNLTGLTYDANAYVKYVAVDTSGNKSAASAQASVLVKAIATTDFTTRLLTAAQMAVGTVDAVVLNADAVDGKTVTAPIIRTTATPNRGLLLSNGGTDKYGNVLPAAGFYAYNSSGAQTFSLDAATGNVALLGTLNAGSTITGSTFQTATFGKRFSMADDPGDFGPMLRYWTGITGAGTETRGYLYPYITGTNRPAIYLAPPSTTTYNEVAALYLSSDVAGASLAYFNGSIFRCTGRIQAMGDLSTDRVMPYTSTRIDIGDTTIPINAPGYIKTGSDSINVVAVNTTYTKAVTFPVAFPAAAPIPTVMLTGNNVSGNTATVRLTVQGVTRSGFNAQIARTVGTGVTNFDWLAVGQ